MVERSLNGFVLGVKTRDAVSAGTRIVVNAASDEIDKLGFRSAIVRRAESGGDGSRMLFAEIEA
jgi:hypothetical protein